jgi:hypothetical protein
MRRAAGFYIYLQTSIKKKKGVVSNFCFIFPHLILTTSSQSLPFLHKSATSTSHGFKSSPPLITATHSTFLKETNLLTSQTSTATRNASLQQPPTLFTALPEIAQLSRKGKTIEHFEYLVTLGRNLEDAMNQISIRRDLRQKPQLSQDGVRGPTASESTSLG